MAKKETTTIDDFQPLTAEWRLDDGAVVQAVRHDGDMRLVTWGKDENPATDEPWIIASASMDGTIETNGGIHGRLMIHHHGDGHAHESRAPSGLISVLAGHQPPPQAAGSYADGYADALKKVRSLDGEPDTYRDELRDPDEPSPSIGPADVDALCQAAREDERRRTLEELRDDLSRAGEAVELRGSGFFDGLALATNRIELMLEVGPILKKGAR